MEHKIIDPTPKQIAKFWSKVNKTSTCWVWTRGKIAFGYGRVRFGTGKGLLYLAHRVSYTLTYGPIPRDLYVCHRCDNPPCVNPEHMFLGTARDNALDSVSKGRFNGWGGAKKGSSQPYAKLTEDDVRQIRVLRSHGLTYREIAKRFGVSISAIVNIIRGTTWRHI